MVQKGSFRSFMERYYHLSLRYVNYVYIFKPPCSTFENFEANLQHAKQKIVLGIPSLQWKG